MSEEKLIALLERTGHFHQAVISHVDSLVPVEDKRFLVAFQASLLSLEHATSALVLISQGLFQSAYTLMRPQYESLVRGIWLLHAATDTLLRFVEFSGADCLPGQWEVTT